MRPVERFTAVVKCPSCGHTDCHRMRDPRPAPTAADLSRWEHEHLTHEIQRWGAKEFVALIDDPPRPADESGYEVIRICRCGHEWGMV